MIAFLMEHTIRSIALSGLVFLTMKALRISDPRLERTLWRITLATLLTMPALLQFGALAPVQSPALEVAYADLAILSAANHLDAWNTVFLCIIGGVSGVLTMRQLIGVGRCWGMRRRATPITSLTNAVLDVRLSSEISAPATVFSTILVPADFKQWSEQAQRLALAHEQSHVSSKDFHVQVLAQMYRSICWFNPFVWWLTGRLALLNEHVSDDAALATEDSRAERVAYAKVLLTLARRPHISAALVPMIRTPMLTLRVERILQDARRRSASPLQVVLLTCMLLPVLVATAAIQSPSRGNHAQRPTHAMLDDTAAVILPRSNPAHPLSQPDYPATSRDSGETGTVVLKLQVRTDGSVAEAMIEESSGHAALDLSALNESRRWQLQPGTIDGSPASLWGRFAVTFRLTPD